MNKIFKTVILAVFLLTAGSIPVISKTTNQPMKTPDFAFPQNVEKDSRRDLEAALKVDRPVDALRAFMNLYIASSLVSRENVPSLIAELDSLCLSFPSPYNAVGYILEAQIYKEIYNSERWTFDSRTVTDDLENENPLFWDRSLFDKKIRSLTDLALSERKEASAMPLEKISPLISFDSNFQSFTVYDFIVYKAIDLNPSSKEDSIIPFFLQPSSSSNGSMELLDSLLTLHSSPSPARNAALVKKATLMSFPENAAFLWSEIQSYGDSHFVAPLLINLYSVGNFKNNDAAVNASSRQQSGVPTLREFYDTVSSINDKLRDSGLKLLLKNMSEESASLYFPDVAQSSKEVQVKVNSSNLSKFYVLLLDLKGNTERYIKIASLPRSTSRIAFQEVTFEDRIPFSDTTVLNFKTPGPGNYTFIVSRSPEIRDILTTSDTFRPTVMQVSDIDLIIYQPQWNRVPRDLRTDSVRGCFVVDASDGQPIEGAKVTFEQNSGSWGQKTTGIVEKSTTDSMGFAPNNFDNAQITATFNGSEARYRSWYSSGTPDKLSSYIRFFTDRAVYRPGDTVKFLAVSYSTCGTEASLAVDRLVKVDLLDANWQSVDSLALVTDASGRIFGQFELPKDGLLGSWRLRDDSVQFQGEGVFQVAEYKTPSFLISLEKESADADSVSFKGKVVTYSGMPIAETKVDFKVVYDPLRWCWFNDPHNRETYASSVMTDANGEFKISLPLENLDPNTYRGTFTISASATDAAGESVDSNSIPFWLSFSYRISPSIPTLVCLSDKPYSLNVPVQDMAGLPVVKNIRFSVLNEKGDTVKSGVFTSPKLEIIPSEYPSGAYRFLFSLEDFPDVPSTECKVIIYRKDDAHPPLESVLWVPDHNLICNDARTSISFGSSFAGQNILCIVSDSRGHASYNWFVSDGANARFEIDSPADNERKYITFIAYRDHVSYTESVTLVPAVQTKKFEIKTETFRSSLEPGKEESWKFVLSFDGQPVEGFAYSLLYDKALDAVAPLRWNSFLFSPSYLNFMRVSASSAGSVCDNFRGLSGGYPPRYHVPRFDFQTYGHSLYDDGLRYMPMHAFSKSRASLGGAEIVFDDTADSFIAEAADAEEVEEGYNGVIAIKAATDAGGYDDNADDSRPEVEFRPAEMPVAFFMPDLNSNKDGVVEINFTVPNFNTTWNFLLGAYTPDMKSAGLSLEAVAAKKVMVKLLAPRFLRTGDEAVITATLYNNSDEDCEIYGVFEIFNPLTGEVVKEVKSPSEVIRPSGNKVVSVSYACPDDISSLGLRVYAKSASASDGEQTVIPVLPSSQPVIESRTFYLAPGTTSSEVSIPIPAFDDARLTFKYCDNPLWYVLTALPDIIFPNSNALTAHIAALYANCVGSGILEKSPNLHKGLKMILDGEAGDSLLVSNLEKDADLKSVLLNNTPWVNDAKSESLRLSNLGSLLDPSLSSQAIRDSWSKILDRHNPDGGWSWCPGMESSVWMTQAFLINVGLLKEGGYLPSLPDLDSSIEGAIAFIDKSYVKNYNEIKEKNKDWFFLSMLNYLYSRSLFPDNKPSGQFKNISKMALDCIDRNWEKMSIFDKATAAITLYKNGHRMTAREILESLRQFTSQSPEKGAWFDNLDSDWRGAGKQLTTARVLTAFHLIQPQDSLIDKMRQWMLIQRQAQDFQEGLWSIDAIDAVLSTGSEWDGEYAKPVIKIAGKEVPQNEVAALTGEITVDIHSSKGDVSIRRFSPTPAWGGIISQFIAPMDQVKADSIEDLSIRKEIWKIEDGPDGEKAVNADEFNVGDKIRVTLIVDCGRDMDFVALTDERAACMEPVDQLSGYDLIDGLWCYQETRNNSTNLFFSFLPRGRHVVSYECRVMEAGVFAAGIATLQCQYSPLLTAHSAGAVLRVR